MLCLMQWVRKCLISPGHQLRQVGVHKRHVLLQIVILVQFKLVFLGDILLLDYQK